MEENESTDGTTVYCAAGCGHSAYFVDEMSSEEIADTLAFLSWKKGVCPECVLAGCKAKSRLDRSLEVAQKVCG